MNTQEALNTHVGRRKYRVNKKRLFRSLSLFGGTVAAICCAFAFAPGPVLTQAAPIQKAPAVLAVSAENRKAAGGPLAGKVIAVDAGHGGFDVGATGVSGVYESGLNLKVAKYLQSELEKEGARVVMTRDVQDAVGPSKEEDMAARRRLIRESGADLVVSIHMNTGADPSASGPVVLFQPGAVKGERLARIIQRSMTEALMPVPENNARSQDLYILEGCTQPGVLVECGFISNAREEALLLQDAYQRKAAAAIARGCAGYFT